MMIVEEHCIKWGQFQTERGWFWLDPREFVAWCLRPQADDDPLTAYL